jgi:hypothetical protein
MSAYYIFFFFGILLNECPESIIDCSIALLDTSVTDDEIPYFLTPVFIGLYFIPAWHNMR